MNLKSLTFDDDFDSFTSSPDGSVGWMTSYTFGGETSRTLPGNYELEYYSDPSVGEDPFSVSGGVLSITATPAAPGSNPYGLPYDSGVITTNGSFQQLYGYFEVRAELPAGQGFWPAFWMLPASGDYKAELDVFEVLGNSPTTVYETVHGSTGAEQTLNVPDLSAGFHTYGVDWEPDFLTYYLDGQAVFKTATPASMDEPMYMLLDLAVGGNGSWPGAPNSTTPFPASLKVDYVRAYATAGTVSVGGPASIPAGSADSALTTLQSIAPIGSDVVVGSGPDTIALRISETPYHGNAQFVVSVDGVQVGGTQTATVLQSSGDSQLFDVMGSFGTGAHTVGINLVNHTYGGSAATDRDLYLDSASIDGTAIANASLSLLEPGTQFFTVPAANLVAPVVLGSGSDTIALGIAEDAYCGDAQFTVSVDGVQVGGTQTATVLQSSGTTQLFDVMGSFGTGPHTVSVDFLNDLFDGSVSTDRNLYLDSASFDGSAVANASLSLYSAGTQSITIPAAVSSASATPPSTTQAGSSQTTAVSGTSTGTGGQPAAGTTATSQQPAAQPDDPLFDASYYLAQNPDVAASGMDPLAHFDEFGWREGRNPDFLFDTKYYLAQNPDVTAAGMDPLVHFEDFGWREGRNPDSLFDTKYYLAHNPDVAASGMDPLVHFDEFGWREGRNPSAAFDTNAYLAANPDVKAAGVDPLAHYLVFGSHEGRAIYAVS